RRADVRSQVDAGLFFFEAAEVFVEAPPVGVQLEVFEEILLVFDERVVQRRDRVAFAGDLGRNALRELAHGAVVNEQVGLRLAEHVNEARRDDEAARLDNARRGCALRRAADEGDLVAADADVAVEPWVAGAVYDATVADKDVVLLREDGGTEKEDCGNESLDHRSVPRSRAGKCNPRGQGARGGPGERLEVEATAPTELR